MKTLRIGQSVIDLRKQNKDDCGEAINVLLIREMDAGVQ